MQEKKRAQVAGKVVPIQGILSRANTVLRLGLALEKSQVSASITSAEIEYSNHVSYSCNT